MAQQEECRIAVMENGRLEELYIERSGTSSHVGNIYKGRVTNVEPSIQACFVDFGIGKNGFLHISDVQSCYFPYQKNIKERVGRKRPRRDRPPIQECLKRSQEIVVQVTKEGIGTKGPTLTSYLSIPGRFMVLMPGMNRTGVSRKIEDDITRNKMRDLLLQLNPPKDMGLILRTASENRTKRELQRDMNYLLRLWSQIAAKIKKEAAPAMLYQESDLVIRTIRDIFNSNVDRILCDSEPTVKKVRDFLSVAMPRTRCRIFYHEEKTPLFDKLNVEREIETIQKRHVPLKSGGSLVIDQTEAIVAIDVNSGKYRTHDDAEMTAFKINMEAAPEIARQLKLRDLGGVIIMDFIDMMDRKHRHAVEKQLRDAVSTDRAKTKILKISDFGIVEMTRQRMRPSLERSTYMDCPHCKGSGMVKSPESVSIDVMRRLQALVNREVVADIQIVVSPTVAFHLQNQNRTVLAEMEKNHRKVITIQSNSELSNDDLRFTCHDARGSVINSEGQPAPPKQ
jgi:ribonuclease E